MNAPTDEQINTLRLGIDALVRVFKVTDIVPLEAGMPKLNPPDVQALLFVAKHPLCIATDVGAFLGVVPTTMSTLVDRLARQGLLIRERTNENRRIVQLALSESGSAVVAAIVAQQNAHCAIMLGHLSPQEREAFLSCVRKIAIGIA